MLGGDLALGDVGGGALLDHAGDLAQQPAAAGHGGEGGQRRPPGQRHRVRPHPEADRDVGESGDQEHPGLDREEIDLHGVTCSWRILAPEPC